MAHFAKNIWYVVDTILMWRDHAEKSQNDQGWRKQIFYGGARLNKKK